MVGPASRPPSAASRADQASGDPRLRRGLALLLGLVLALLPAAPAFALAWPWALKTGPEAGAELAAPGLQEIAPPLGVQQLRPLLEMHQPQLRILAPKADSLMPAGSWTLRLELNDWPLVDAGPLGLGPHLVVQLDDEPPRRLTSTSTSMPALAPGSHRLSVVAAMPWGEAVGSPGSFAQIRLHRSAVNPLAGPAAGTPQLIPLLPVASPPGQPLLLDWLLVDAPLQHLRDGDESWRLRLSLDGASLLLDRQEALWLQGPSPGSHPLLLELLDLRGAPLNPPFNSLVRELVVDADSPAPAWLPGPLSAADLARLSGAAAPTSASGDREQKAQRQPDRQPDERDGAAVAASAPAGGGPPTPADAVSLPLAGAEPADLPHGAPPSPSEPAMPLRPSGGAPPAASSPAVPMAPAPSRGNAVGAPGQNATPSLSERALSTERRAGDAVTTAAVTAASVAPSSGRENSGGMENSGDSNNNNVEGTSARDQAPAGSVPADSGAHPFSGERGTGSASATSNPSIPDPNRSARASLGSDGQRAASQLSGGQSDDARAGEARAAATLGQAASFEHANPPSDAQGAAAPQRSGTLSSSRNGASTDQQSGIPAGENNEAPDDRPSGTSFNQPSGEPPTQPNSEPTAAISSGIRPAAPAPAVRSAEAPAGSTASSAVPLKGPDPFASRQTAPAPPPEIAGTGGPQGQGRSGSSRSVNDNASSPSLTPRSSPPEPFDPWSSLLPADAAAPQPGAIARSRGSGLLDRVLQPLRR